MSQCKSSGTLISVGANDVVISDRGELGPLDVQVTKPGEFGEWSSGLTAIQSLNTLQTQARNLFSDWFVWLRLYSGYQITTKLASEIASQAAVGLFSEIYAQIDPMRLGEIDREIKIALEYGDRIGTANLKTGALTRLVAGYPSHAFVIDREEATQLINNVRGPNDSEQGLEWLLRPYVRTPIVSPALPLVVRLDEWLKPVPPDQTSRTEVADASFGDGKEASDAGEHDVSSRATPTGEQPPSGADTSASRSPNVVTDEAATRRD